MSSHLATGGTKPFMEKLICPIRWLSNKRCCCSLRVTPTPHQPLCVSGTELAQHSLQRLGVQLSARNKTLINLVAHMHQATPNTWPTNLWQCGKRDCLEGPIAMLMSLCSP